MFQLFPLIVLYRSWHVLNEVHRERALQLSLSLPGRYQTA
jgi:hypothetical protein